MEVIEHPGSFRDPSGNIFYKNNVIYRQINKCYEEEFDHLIDSGLYETLRQKNLIVEHEDEQKEKSSSLDLYKVIRPERLDMISYPYEWSFSQLKDAALATLEIQKEALKKGMILKDATAYNIQFHKGKPIFIDTLSFEKYVPGQPWKAYRQFCQHFLAPLALMSKVDLSFNQILRIHLDGIPLGFASKVLGKHALFSPRLYMHIRLHSRAQVKYNDMAEDASAKKKEVKVSKIGLLGLTDSLIASVKGLTLPKSKTEWGDYYNNTNYDSDSFKTKKVLVEDFIKEASVSRESVVWDFGGNTGVFSRLAREYSKLVVSADIDPLAVEANYLQCKKDNEEKVIPILLDLTNPSPGIGWSNEERDKIDSRGDCELSMALALVHHLAISNNLPLEKIAKFFADFSEKLIIEFVPKEDSQVKRLLFSREDIFPDYNHDGFEVAFSKYFSLEKKSRIEGTARTLYLMKRLQS